MKILYSSFPRIEKGIEKGVILLSWGFVLMGCALFIWSLCPFLTSLFDSLHPKEKIQKDSVIKKGKKQEYKEKILLTGPLRLKENHRSSFEVALEQKLDLKGQSSRPDFEKGKMRFCIGIQGTSQERIVKEGEALSFEVKLGAGEDKIERVRFAPCQEGEVEGKILHFSCCGFDKEALLLKGIAEGGQELELILHSSECKGAPLLSPEFTSLKEATWWGKDMLFAQYGGEHYFPLSQKYRLEICPDHKQPYVLYVAPDDFLIYRQGKWEVTQVPSKETQGLGLAQVLVADGSALEIKAWNVEGIALFQTTLHPARVKGGKGGMEKIFGSARLRSAKQVSCKMEKKHLLLKGGDWVVKTKGGWHKLKTLSDFEDVLTHKVKGELVVVDEIDPKGVLKGHYFDEMRIQKISLSIPVLADKKKSKKKKEGGV